MSRRHDIFNGAAHTSKSRDSFAFPLVSVEMRLNWTIIPRPAGTLNATLITTQNEDNQLSSSKQCFLWTRALLENSLIT